VNKILLTGSSGFIGSNLLKDLSQNNKVYVILRKKQKKFLKDKNIIQIYYNNYQILDKKIKKIKVNTVIHCATHYVKQHKIDDIKKFSNSNILFGNIILENLKIMGVKKFINFSTVWENFNGERENYFNLYSAYKASFLNIINFYKRKLNKIKFFNLVISDTFGKNDKRKKIINLLKNNYKKNLKTKIVSKNLYMNLLNVVDINNAVKLILKSNYKSGTYSLNNNRDYKISDIIDDINNNLTKKIKITWLSKKILKEKIYKFKILKNWKTDNSKIKNITSIIAG
tara:strand:+ start:4833 stop:5684 length:852 start_codon:yes stop_codon:yes gene_type:complete